MDQHHLHPQGGHHQGGASQHSHGHGGDHHHGHSKSPSHKSRSSKGHEEEVEESLLDIAKRVVAGHGFWNEFRDHELQALAKIKSPVPFDAGDKAIKDLRHLQWFSVDNDDSLDLDQLTYAETATGQGEGQPKEFTKVFVSIADVTTVVHKGDALDRFAAHNTCSVYTPIKNFLMLPPRLSTDFTSLNEGVDRLSMVMELHVGPDGVIFWSDVYQAWAHNYAKLAYNSVAAWLDAEAAEAKDKETQKEEKGESEPTKEEKEKEGKEKEEGKGGETEQKKTAKELMPEKIAHLEGLADQVRLQARTAELIRQERERRGALVFESANKVWAVVDKEAGKAVAIKAVGKNNVAQRIIENFMIAANHAVTHFLVSHDFPVIKRIVREPERWEKIAQLGRTLEPTQEWPEGPNVKVLQQFLVSQKQKNPKGFSDLSLTIIKLMGRGEYIVESDAEGTVGHFALAEKEYTHSTAPNRRFVDMVIQRMLKAAFKNEECPYTMEELEEIVANCTDNEIEADKVERQVMKSAIAQVYAPRIGESFKSMVIGASDLGTWIRLLAPEPPVEGKLVKGYLGLDVGDLVDVKLLRADDKRGYVDFENPTGEGDEEQQQQQSHGGKEGGGNNHSKRPDTRKKKAPRQKKVERLVKKRNKRKGKGGN